MSVMAPYLVKVAIDEHIAVGDITGLTVITAVTLVVYLINYVASARQIVIMSQVGQEILMTLRAQLFRHLQRLPLGYFHRVPTGVTVSRLINDVLAMNEVLTNGLLSLFTDVLLLFSTIAIMLYLSPRLALVTFGVMPIMVVAIWIFTERAKVAYRRTRQTVGAVAAGFQENVDGVRVVQAFSREEVNEDQFDRLNEDNRQANVSANTLSSGLMPVIECANALATVAVVWYGGSLVLAGDGEVTLGVLVAFLTYVTRFFQPLRELTQFYNQLQAAMAGAEKVFELLDEPVTLAERRNPISLESVRGDVEFQDVGFGYNVDDRLVLRDVSFEIPAGTMTALVGHTGAGKTTISALLARFYDPSEGAVLLDGHDLRDLSFATLRKNMAVVLQDNFLFAGTIADNIRYGRPDATDEQIVAGGEAGPRPRVHRALPERLRDPGDGAGRQPLARAAPVDRHRPRRAGRSARPDPGRGDLERRSAHRGPAPAGAEHAAGRPDQPGRRPPPQHDPRGRPGAGDRRRRDRGAGPPRGAAPAAGRLLPSSTSSSSPPPRRPTPPKALTLPKAPPPQHRVASLPLSRPAARPSAPRPRSAPPARSCPRSPCGPRSPRPGPGPSGRSP